MKEKEKEEDELREKVPRIEKVAIHPEDIELLQKFGNEKVRNKIREFGHRGPI